MKQNILMPVLAILCVGCNSGGKNDSVTTKVTPPIYQGNSPEQYKVDIGNGNVLQTTNYMMFPANETNKVTLYLESVTSVVAVNMTSSDLNLSPSVCNFDANNQICTISVSPVSLNKLDLQNNVSYYSIIPSFNSQNLTPIQLAFAQPVNSPVAVNMNGTWKVSYSNLKFLDPVTCAPSTLIPYMAVINGNNITRIFDDGDIIESSSNKINPFLLPKNGYDNEYPMEYKYNYLSNGTIGGISYLTNCNNFTSYTTWTKISDSTAVKQ